MILSDIILRVADDGNVNSTISSVKDRIIREINRISQEIWDGYRWSFRFKNYRIVTDVDVTAGTITATNGSRTITGAGTSFSSSHETWHIYFPSDVVPNWYKVNVYTSATQLELDVPYQGSTGGSKAYVLRHFDYFLPSESWDLGSVTVTSDNKPVSIIEPSGMDIIGAVPHYRGRPEAVSIYSSEGRLFSIYNTGTVSCVINSTTITGAGTAWLSNAAQGDLISIGDYEYTIRSVNSDTSLSIYNRTQIAATAASHIIKTQFRRLLRVMWPSDANYSIDVRALRKYWPLVNDGDSNELMYRYPNVIILKAAALELKQQNDLRSRELEASAELALAKAKAEDDCLTPKESVAPLFTYRGGSRERSFR